MDDRIFVAYPGLRQIAADCNTILANVNRINADFKNTVSQLDWEIKVASDIDATANRLSRSLEGCTQALREYQHFANDAHDKYVQLDNWGIKSDTNIGGGNGGVSNGRGGFFNWALTAAPVIAGIGKPIAWAFSGLNKGRAIGNSTMVHSVLNVVKNGKYVNVSSKAVNGRAITGIKGTRYLETTFNKATGITKTPSKVGGVLGKVGTGVAVVAGGIMVGSGIHRDIKSGATWQQTTGNAVAEAGWQAGKFVAIKTSAKVGAIGGAKVGAAIGTVFGPAGIVVGGVVGGIVGAVATGLATSAILDKVATPVKQVASTVVQGVINVGSSVVTGAAKAVSSVVKKLKFW